MNLDPDYGKQFPIANAMNLTWTEVMDHKTGLVRVTPRFWRHCELWQALRSWWGAPLRTTNGYRTALHNAQVGGAGNSQHLLFLNGSKDDDRFATDQVPDLSSPLSNGDMHDAIGVLAGKAESLGFTGIGMYPKFLHLDLRDGSVVVWDERY